MNKNARTNWETIYRHEMSHDRTKRKTHKLTLNLVDRFNQVQRRRFLLRSVNLLQIRQVTQGYVFVYLKEKEKGAPGHKLPTVSGQFAWAIAA